MFSWLKKKSANHAQGTGKSDIEKLAEQVAIAIIKHSEKNDCKYLCYSEITKMDCAVFACFLIRGLCLGAASNRESAMTFSNKFIHEFIACAKNTFNHSDVNLFEKLFNNRVNFYDRVFMSKKGIDAKIDAILEEFEIIIKTDIVNKGYVSFSENSPLPMLSDGMFGDMKCHMEAVSFLQNLPVLLAPYFDRVQKSL